VTKELAPRAGLNGTPVSVASAGKVAVLGLEGIRFRLQDRWEVLSEKVHAYFNALLERELKPGDCFHKIDELSYLVLFRNLSVAEAQLKCVAIAESASRRLFGEDIGAVSIRVVVATIDNELLLQALDPIATVETILKNIGSETIVSSRNDHSPDRDADCGQHPKHLTAAAQPLKIEFGSDTRHTETLALDRITFQYRPVWDSIRKVVLTYLCQPMSPSETGVNTELPARGYCVATESDQAFLLDLHVLQEVVGRMEVLRREGFRIVAACPVHFATIAHSRSWNEYLRLLDKAGGETVRDIAFLLIGIEAGVPNVRLVQEVPKLSLRSKLVFAAIDYQEGGVSRFERTGIHAIGIELRHIAGPERQLLATIDALAQESEHSGMASFVLGAKSKSTVISAIASGVRYLEGHIIAAPVVEPRHAFVRNIADLYR
jgi:hypothetical protein